jgi:hypothetical protein
MASVRGKQCSQQCMYISTAKRIINTYIIYIFIYTEVVLTCKYRFMGLLIFSWKMVETNNKTKQTLWPESVSELYRPCNHRLSMKLVPTFADRGCCVVSATDPYCHNLGFLDWNRYFSFQVAPQLYSWGWVDPVPHSLHLRKSDSAVNRTWASGSVARNSDH